MTIRGCRAGTAPRAAVRPVEPLPDVLGPDLPGAACKGHGELFDDWREHRTPDGRYRHETPTDRAERHTAAMRICWTLCPIREQCLATRDAQPALGAGIYGGVLFERWTSPDPIRRCRCGTIIPTDANPQRVHCSDECRQATYERTRGTPATRRTRTCGCGTVFTGVPGQKCRDCRRVSFGERVCADPGCGTRFVPESPQQRFHTKRCGNRVNKRASKARVRARRRASRAAELGVAS
jgi:hypothetical protein